MGVRFPLGAPRIVPILSGHVASKFENMYFVYLLENNTKRWYIGYTPDTVFNRLIKHNNGEVPSTKPYLPWHLIYYEGYLNIKDATGREKFLKSGAGRNFLKKQIKHYLTTK